MRSPGAFFLVPPTDYSSTLLLLRGLGVRLLFSPRRMEKPSLRIFFLFTKYLNRQRLPSRFLSLILLSGLPHLFMTPGQERTSWVAPPFPPCSPLFAFVALLFAPLGICLIETRSFGTQTPPMAILARPTLHLALSVIPDERFLVTLCLYRRYLTRCWRASFRSSLSIRLW